MILYDPFHVVQTKYLFLTGKGGVGKTSVACATAVALVDAGKKVLLISTDPASNLQDVFSMELTNKATPIAAVPNLAVANLDPVQAAAEYRESVIGPYRGLLPEAALRNMEEQLSGSCTVEIAAFNEFTNFLTDEAVACGYDHIIFDTAPTGHTLLLLESTESYDREIRRTHGSTPPSVQHLLPRLKGDETEVVIVTLPEATPVYEALRLEADLKRTKLRSKWWVINKSFYQARTTSPLLKAKASHEIAWINKVDDHTQGHTALIAWRPDEVRGEVLGKL